MGLVWRRSKQVPWGGEKIRERRRSSYRIPYLAPIVREGMPVPRLCSLCSARRVKSQTAIGWMHGQLVTHGTLWLCGPCTNFLRGLLIAEGNPEIRAFEQLGFSILWDPPGVAGTTP